MTDYTAPLDDLKFLLHRVVGLDPLLDDALTPADVDAVLEEAGKLAAGVLAPLNRVGDTDPPRLENGVVRTAPGWRDAYQRFVEGGWGAITAPPAHGGQGLPLPIGMAVGELWNAANMAFALNPMLTQAAVEALDKHGTPAQQAKYLPPLVSGRWTGSMNLTEPQAGSDVGALRTRAVRENGHYRLTGQKVFITYGEHDLTDNIIHMVLARLPDAPPGVKGISLFLVPKLLVDDDGRAGARNDVRAVTLEHKLGIHGSPTVVLAFGDDGGAYAELVGEENRGIECMFTMMNNARLAVGLQGVSIADRAYQQARAYARSRIQGRGPDGKPAPIIRHADVRRMLAAAKVKTEASRALVLEAAVALERARRGDAAAQRRGDLLIPVAKAWCTDIGVEVASIGIQVHGGMGFMEETGAAQHYRDARIAPIYEGTNGIQAADLVGRKLQRDGGAAMQELLQDIDATVALAAARPGDDLATIAGKLEAAAAALQRTAAWLLAAEAPAAAAGATPFLEMTGLTVGGWLMARAGLAAQDAQFAGGADAAFMEAKIVAARVYAEHLLPQVDAIERAVTAGAASLLALDERFL